MRITVLLITLLALSGCGLSPQLIQIHPELARAAENLGQNTAVNLSVVDQRSNAAFGTRGGLYKDTALIRPAEDFTTIIASALKQALQERGYNAYNPGDDAMALDIRVARLDYVPEAGSVVNKVEVNAEIQAIAQNASGDRYTGTYKTGNTYEQPLTPSASRNEQMINEVLQRALDKVLADTALHAFLTGQQTADDAPAEGTTDTVAE